MEKIKRISRVVGIVQAIALGFVIGLIFPEWSDLRRFGLLLLLLAVLGAQRFLVWFDRFHDEIEKEMAE